MPTKHKIAFCADQCPYVTHEIQVPPTTWRRSLKDALDFLTPQWELGTAIADELRKATSEFSIGHTRDLKSVASSFQTQHHESWQSLRFALPDDLRSDRNFTAMEPFWCYVFEAMFGQAPGLATMIERNLISLRITDGLGGKYTEVFGQPSESVYIPGIKFRWAHPTRSIPNYRLSKVALSERPEIIEGWRA